MAEPDPDRNAKPSSSYRTQSTTIRLPAMSTLSSDTCPKSDVFSLATKAEIKRLAGNRCWACEAIEPQICHVVAKEDRQVDVWFDAGLLTFDLTATANGIPLCGTCHIQFDLAHDPGFIFIPVDLEYFIKFELEDRKRRSTGNDIRRQVPTNLMYRDHLLKEKIIADGTTSGLYRPVFLKEYYPWQNKGSTEYLRLTKPKVWPGAPIATLRRAILALGSARITSLDKATVVQLQTLRDLYFGPLDDNLVDIRSLVQPSHGQKRQTSKDDEKQHQTKRFKGDLTNEQEGMKEPEGLDQPEDTDKPEPINENQGCLCAYEAGWVLGPSFTTEQIVRQYAPVFAND